jgi:hypothetical protein
VQISIQSSRDLYSSELKINNCKQVQYYDIMRGDNFKVSVIVPVYNEEGCILNHVQGSQVLMIADPVESYEMSVSLKTYLFYEDNINLYYNY